MKQHNSISECYVDWSFESLVVVRPFDGTFLMLSFDISIWMLLLLLLCIMLLLLFVVECLQYHNALTCIFFVYGAPFMVVVSTLMLLLLMLLLLLLLSLSFLYILLFFCIVHSSVDSLRTNSSIHLIRLALNQSYNIREKNAN